MGTEHETDDLKRLAPTLASLAKVDPFAVPEGFFERFPHQVQARVTASRPVPGLAPWVKRLALALPMVAALTGAWWMFRTTDTPVEQVSVEIPAASVDDLELLDHAEAFAELAEENAADLDLPAPGIDLSEDELAVWLEHERTDPTELIAEL